MRRQFKAKTTTSLVCTVLNEHETIEHFLNSLLKQTKIPGEVIIVDGGSSDTTNDIVAEFQKTHKKLPIKLLHKNGNRAVGRNYGIKKAKGEILLLSDAGCVLAPDWVKKISQPFSISSAAVVAGYYRGRAASIFQKSLLPYVLVMPDKINPNHFLPSTRSMAMKKNVWKRLGGFPEAYSHNEDYVFAKELERKRVKIIFAKKAIVYWLPRKTLKSAFIMFFRFAYGDSEAGIFRAKVLFIFLRYFVFVALLAEALRDNESALYCSIILIFLYFFWAVMKNYRYVKNLRALFFLPLLQISSDIAVLAGTSAGILQLFRNEVQRSVKRVWGMLQ